ncbi:MAG: type II 3-dehydroquinate dehydratase [Candidatus Kapaibacterium sp.]|jgi:3-dehydroquinate dehydratase-2
MHILVLNGPNLNLLGEREPEIYGHATLEEILSELMTLAGSLGAELRCIQSNHEGILIDTLQNNRHWFDAIIFNPGAFTHYSYALRDAVAGTKKPMIEVHLSDLSKREAFRQHSVFDGLSNVTRIMGYGAEGYTMALQTLVSTTPEKQ